jgi:hypothetical protein
LKTQDWRNHLEKEMALCINNTIPLLVNGENNNDAAKNNILNGKQYFQADYRLSGVMCVMTFFHRWIQYGT